VKKPEESDFREAALPKALTAVFVTSASEQLAVAVGILPQDGAFSEVNRWPATGARRRLKQPAEGGKNHELPKLRWSCVLLQLRSLCGLHF